MKPKSMQALMLELEANQPRDELVAKLRKENKALREMVFGLQERLTEDAHERPTMELIDDNGTPKLVPFNRTIKEPSAHLKETPFFPKRTATLIEPAEDPFPEDNGGLTLYDYVADLDDLATDSILEPMTKVKVA